MQRIGGPKVSRRSGVSFRWPPWIAAGVTLMLLHGALAWISGQFKYDIPLSQRPLLLMTALLSTAGLVYLAAVRLHLREPASARLLGWIFVVGLFLRLAMMASHPMQEVDFYRYLRQ